MAVTLNHTIVPARDKRVSATFIAEILGVAVGEDTPPFVPVRLANGVTLDFMSRSDVTPQHYAFLLDDPEWDAAHERLRARGIRTWADPDFSEPDAINTRWGGRGLYFRDPDGHSMEIMTAAPDHLRQEATPAVGLELVNPKAGTTTRFTATAETTDGAYVEIIATYPPDSAPPPMHLHPHQTEHFTLLAGSIEAVVGGESRTLRVGDELVIPPGTCHQMWAGTEGAEMRWRTSPALRTGELFCATWAVAQANDWSPTGLQLFEVVTRFEAEFRLC